MLIVTNLTQLHELKMYLARITGSINGDSRKTSHVIVKLIVKLWNTFNECPLMRSCHEGMTCLHSVGESGLE